MTTVTGLPPAVASLPGVPIDRFPTAAAVQARQAEAANGRTLGAGATPLTIHGLTGPVGLDHSRALQDRRIAATAPPPEEPAGPPPTFRTTPLEKLRYPPSPLQELARRQRHAPAEKVQRSAGTPRPGQPDPGPVSVPGSGPLAGTPSGRVDAARGPDATVSPAHPPSRMSGYQTQTDAVRSAVEGAVPDNGGLNIRR